MTKSTLKQLSNPFTALILIVAAGFTFASLTASAQTAPLPTPTQTPSNDQGSEQRTKSEEKERYSVCFYSQPNYRGDSICRSAPSRVGVFDRNIGNNIGSIKIKNSSGREVTSPQINLKICENIWRRGICMVLNGSQSDLLAKFPNPVRSYAFDVRS